MTRGKRQVLKTALRFAWHYKLLSIALITIIVGLVLEVAKQRTAAHWLLAIVALGELLPLIWNMWQDLRTGKYGIDILAATAVITSVILGQYWAAIIIVVMLTGGEGLEHYAEHRARGELNALLEHAPRIAHLLRKGKVLDVHIDELQVGDKFIIKAGELVPVDSVIIEGAASFDESSLTGESLPQAKQTGDALVSGSINLDATITAKATVTADDSQYQTIIELVRAAAASKAPFVRLADRYSIPFTIISFIIAGTVWVISGQAVRFLEVIVVATPCPLLLAAPIALVSGMARASRYGIIVRSGSALEKLAEVQTMAFDKTGTLTSGNLAVDAVITFSPYKKNEILALAASLEQNSHHVLATAIVSAAKTKGLKFTRAKHVRENAGRGLLATIRGQEVIAGRFSLLQERGVQIPPAFRQNEYKQTAVYVGINGKLAGVITLKDQIRPETKTTINQLKNLGIRELMMVTGDHTAAAQSIAKKLGIEHVHADALPADKLQILDEAKHRPLAFVGDGINDAPILTASDLGIALGARGETAASESADIVIIPDDLMRVATAVTIAKRTFRIAQQSIFVGIALSLILMGIFATGKFPPLAGAIVQEIVDVVVIFNALRAHSGTALSVD